MGPGLGAPGSKEINHKWIMEHLTMHHACSLAGFKMALAVTTFHQPLTLLKLSVQWADPSLLP